MPDLLVPPSRFVTSVSRSLVLLSAGLLLALVLAAALAWNDLTTPLIIGGAPRLAQWVASDAPALLLGQAVLWLFTLVSAIGLQRRRNWARLSIISILIFHVLYGILVSFAFPAMIPS